MEMTGMEMRRRQRVPSEPDSTGAVAHKAVAMAPSSLDAPDPRRWPALGVVLAASFLGVLDFFIVNVSIPSIRDDLHADSAAVQLMIAGYGLAYAVLLITGGRLGDIFGRKRMFLYGVHGVHHCLRVLRPGGDARRADRLARPARARRRR